MGARFKIAVGLAAWMTAMPAYAADTVCRPGETAAKSDHVKENTAQGLIAQAGIAIAKGACGFLIEQGIDKAVGGEGKVVVTVAGFAIGAVTCYFSHADDQIEARVTAFFKPNLDSPGLCDPNVVADIPKIAFGSLAAWPGPSDPPFGRPGLAIKLPLDPNISLVPLIHPNGRVPTLSDMANVHLSPEVMKMIELPQPMPASQPTPAPRPNAWLTECIPELNGTHTIPDSCRKSPAK